MDLFICQPHDGEVCGDCKYFNGEECDGQNEGSEKSVDSAACSGFEETEKDEN